MTNDQIDLGNIIDISSKAVALVSLGNYAENHGICDACVETMIEYDQAEDFDLPLKSKQDESWGQHAAVEEMLWIITH